MAANLGLSVASLRRLGVGWADRSMAWAFPMVDAAGRIRGIRLRSDSGRKFAVKGGHEGLFVPDGLDGSGLILAPEGPTNSAALLDLGFEVVGRPSCSGGSGILVDLVRRRRPAEVVIVADRDQPTRLGTHPGQDGARALSLRLVAFCRRLRILMPPPGFNDAREWRRAGVTREEVSAAIEAAPVVRLSGRTSMVVDPAPRRVGTT